MENKLPVTQCQYCGSRDIGEGWQHGEALVTFLYQCVAEPQKYKQAD